MQKKILYLVPFILYAAVLQAQNSGPFSWLEGNWRINTGKGILVESWKRINDSTLSGASFFIRGGKDTIPQETIELSLRNGNWNYIPVAKGQNNDQPVVFVVIFQKGTEFIAENKAHDFPQRIVYRRIKDGLYASIEGSKNGKYNKQNFDFTLPD